jgi:hypothetical protein
MCIYLNKFNALFLLVVYWFIVQDKKCSAYYYVEYITRFYSVTEK